MEGGTPSFRRSALRRGGIVGGPSEVLLEGGRLALHCAREGAFFGGTLFVAWALGGGLRDRVVRFVWRRLGVMAEVTSIRETLKTLGQRAEALRGYL